MGLDRYRKGRAFILKLLSRMARAGYGLLIGAALTGIVSRPAESATQTQGEYLFKAAGCLGCHTNTAAGSQKLAGGRALKTPFGTFYTPNITPDPVYGIGKWSAGDFIRAMRWGVGREGEYLYPAFPFTSYRKMSIPDLVAIYQYLMTQPAVAQPNKPHDLSFPFNIRLGLKPWRDLFLSEEEAWRPDPGKSQQWNRGAYLVEAVSHCGECHTPRGILGNLSHDGKFSGTEDGPEGSKVPNITPHDLTGIGRWADDDLESLLTLGLLPDGDVVGDTMGEVVQNSTSALIPQDRHAIIDYLRSLPPVENKVAPATQPE